MKQIEYTPMSKGVVQSEETVSKRRASGGGTVGRNSLSEKKDRENEEDVRDLDLEEQLVSALYLVQTKNETRERSQDSSRETQRRSSSRTSQESRGRAGAGNSQELQRRSGAGSAQETQRRSNVRTAQASPGKSGAGTTKESLGKSGAGTTKESLGKGGAGSAQEPRRKSSAGTSRGDRVREREGVRKPQRRDTQESSRRNREQEELRESLRSRREAEAARKDRKRLEAEWRKEVRPRKRRKKGNPGLVLILCALFVLLAGGGGGWLYVDSLAYKVCRVEAGVEVKPSDFLKKPDETAIFTKDSQTFDISQPGEYRIKVKSGLFTHNCKLIIEDTVAPQGQPVDMRLEEGSTCEAEQFVTDIVDATQVTVAYGIKPDFYAVGEQTVQVMLTDKGGNQTNLEAKLTVFPMDTEPPQIIGAKDLTIFVGDSVSYKKDVTVEDNNPEGVELSVDSSAVNLKEAGVYPVVYTATDVAGNTTSVTVNLTVKAREHGIDEVNALADKVLAKIITPDMTLEQKARAIFDYNKSHIGYINNSDKSDWVKAAYEGLAVGQGDCYVYACTAKVLLTRAGIPNMDIEKIPSETLHYWNLVDVGDGWYHFDTTPRVDHPVIYMWTDEKLMEYSKNHKNCHNYDHSAYPKVN